MNFEKLMADHEGNCVADRLIEEYYGCVTLL